jgi:uncharacterized protein (DUF488 family)
LDDFTRLLASHGVTCIVDVRSNPYSRYCPQFNQESLAVALHDADIKYIYLGDQLGARPSDALCYDGNHVNFEHVAQTEEFKLGLSRLIDAASEYRVAIMCAEKEPLECHRCILICRHIKDHNLCIKHILADGSIEDHSDTERRLVRMLKIEATLFEPAKTIADFIEQAYDQQARNISYDSESEVSRTTHDAVKH